MSKLQYRRAYVINIMVVLIIFPVILQTVINVIMLSIGGQGAKNKKTVEINENKKIKNRKKEKRKGEGERKKTEKKKTKKKKRERINIPHSHLKTLAALVKNVNGKQLGG